MALHSLLGQPRSHVASRPRRAFAQVIDGAIFGPPFLGYFWFHDLRRRGEDGVELASPGRRHPVVEIVSFALQVQAERGRTPGFRLLRLRMVNSRSGADLGLPTALARVVIVRAPTYLVKAFVGRSKLSKRAEESARRLQEIRPQLEALRAEHTGDEAALRAATRALYEQEAINPFASCGPVLAQVALSAPLGFVARTLRDRLTGKTVVVELGTRKRRVLVRALGTVRCLFRPRH